LTTNPSNKNKEPTWFSKITAPKLVIIRHPETLEKIGSLHTNYLQLLTVPSVFALATFIIGMWLGSKDIGNSPKSESGLQILKLAMEIDSLAQEVERRDKQIANIKQVIQGNIPDNREEEERKNNKTEISPKDNDIDLNKISSQDLALRREFESKGVSFLPIRGGADKDISILPLIPPVEGLISSDFNAEKKHLGIDIVARKDEPVKCAADGTVILSSWTEDTGYVIAVQHQGNVITVYKHNAALLKKSGDLVQAGEIIAFVGNTGELTTGPHLHFELWQNGLPLNPREFIAF
jgi:murein DD-endopeptidase MepM/ murein hydrolase activator NlpD